MTLSLQYWPTGRRGLSYRSQSVVEYFHFPVTLRFDAHKHPCVMLRHDAGQHRPGEASSRLSKIQICIDFNGSLIRIIDYIRTEPSITLMPVGLDSSMNCISAVKRCYHSKQTGCMKHAC